MSGPFDALCQLFPGGLARSVRCAAGVAAVVLASLGAGPARAQETGAVAFGDIQPRGIRALDQSFPYEARDVTVAEVIQTMGLRAKVPVIAGDGLGGRIDVSNSDGSVRDLLETLRETGKAQWWFDGVAVHVEPASALVSRLLPLNGVGMPDLRRHMHSVGLDDTVYPLIADDGATMVRAVGPQGYVEAVEQVIAALAAQIAPRAQRPLPTIIRGPGRSGVPRLPQAYGAPPHDGRPVYAAQPPLVAVPPQAAQPDAGAARGDAAPVPVDSGKDYR